MKLRNRRSFLRHGAEHDAPRRFRPRITQFIYLLVLFAIVAYAVWYTVNYMVTFDARGQMVSETIVIAAARAGRIQALPVRRGTELQTGDLLTRIQPPQVCEPLDQRRQSIQADIAINEARIQGLTERIRQLRSELDAMGLSRALELDAGTDAGAERRLRGSLTELRTERQTLREENRILRQRRRSLEPDPECQPEVITAPVDSHVVARHRDMHESVRPGDAIVTLRSPAAAPLVIAYLPADELQSVARGDQVTVNLPDGSSETGRIRRIRSSGEDRANTLWDGYQRERTDIALEIEPVQADQESNWRRFHLMEVEVEGRRR